MIARLTRPRILTAVAVVGVLGLCAVAWFVGDSHALGGLTVRHATPEELAAAMNNDEFYGDYREDSLIVAGPVASVTLVGSIATLAFTTHGAFGTQCLLQPGQPTIHVGDTITVVTEGYAAQRLPTAVLLTGCVVVGTL